MTLAKKLAEFSQKKERAMGGGGPKAIEKQLAMGKMPARQRIEAILDA
ncbi:MAG: hypothetical protein HY901_21370, partial [Deltaproteobacteria bacterium]|nr:hypothetical protein [Deltaproteobacteria bacterium]